VDMPVEVGVDRGLIVAQPAVGRQPLTTADLATAADARRQDRRRLTRATRRDRARQEVAGAVDTDRLLPRAVPRPDARRLPDVDAAVARGVAGRRDRATDDHRALERAASEGPARERATADLVRADAVRPELVHDLGAGHVDVGEIHGPREHAVSTDQLALHVDVIHDRLADQRGMIQDGLARDDEAI